MRPDTIYNPETRFAHGDMPYDFAALVMLVGVVLASLVGGWAAWKIILHLWRWLFD